MQGGKNIIYAGTSGFPFGFAQIERQKLISLGLIASGNQVLILCRNGIFSEGGKYKYPESGRYEGIPFQYASGSPYRPDAFLKRNLLKLKGLLNEIRIIWKLKRQGKADFLLVSANFFSSIFFYKLISVFLNIPLVLDNVEHWTSIGAGGQKKLPEKIDNYLYDQYSHRLSSRVICISNFLKDIASTSNPGKPVIKIPAIVDFSKFVKNGRPETAYILYCGQAGYFEVIDFIIQAFEKSDSGDVELHVISHGEPEQMKKVIDRIASSRKSEKIKLFSGLPYPELVSRYMGSRALLIPLRNTPQDIARFPHKIGEYCAAGRPIISTNFGEVKYYFRDMENALLAENFDVDQYAEKITFAIQNPGLAEELGSKSFETGQKNFNHLELGKKIDEFLS
jgi:glycosyltransferase involved in cell wall biosynthesis